MKRILTIPLLGATAASLFGASGTAPKEQMNVLLITADDLDWTSVGVWGSQVADITPNIDRFASQSLIFRHAHVASAVSQPSRGALATGMYPHTSGVEGFNHTDGYVPTVMSELRSHGYLTGILGKCGHSTPDENFVWDMTHDEGELGKGRDPQKYADYFRQFIRDCKKAGKPFYFMANSHDPHRPWHGSRDDLKMHAKFNYPAPSRTYTPDEVEIPGFLPDIDSVRLELSQYFSSVHRFDDTFGAILKVLEEEGLSDRTAVFFLSDNGMSQPFSKTNAYYNSTHTPLMVRYPGVTKAGSVDGVHFVSGIDFMPTVLESLGYAIPDGVEGRSYLPLLKGQTQENRDKVFTQFYENSTKNRFPMFAVQDAKYLLIYNPWADGHYRFRSEWLGGIAFRGMVEAGKTNSSIQSRVDLLLYRVPLELYDLEKDPNALINLAKEPEYKDVVKQYSDELLNWMKRYDPTVVPAFTEFMEKDERAKYMEIQMTIPAERQKRQKAAQ